MIIDNAYWQWFQCTGLLFCIKGRGEGLNFLDEHGREHSENGGKMNKTITPREPSQFYLVTDEVLLAEIGSQTDTLCLKGPMLGTWYEDRVKWLRVFMHIRFYYLHGFTNEGSDT